VPAAGAVVAGALALRENEHGAAAKRPTALPSASARKAVARAGAAILQVPPQARSTGRCEGLSRHASHRSRRGATDPMAMTAHAPASRLSNARGGRRFESGGLA
jgi:hypothetical protein